MRHYAKKYPESEFGKHPISKVEVQEIAQIKKGYAEAQAFFTVEEMGIYEGSFTLRREPLGWEVKSWEIEGRP